ncbi:MAG: hypothetical protein ABIN55_06580 [Aeromicrobium sp.]
MHTRSSTLSTRVRRLDRLTLIAIGLIVIQLAFRTWAAGNSWFEGDDFIFLGAAAHGDADRGWLFEPQNVHLMPVGLFLSTLVGHAGAFTWWLAVVEIVALQGLADLAFWWMLRTLFGNRKAVVAVLAIFLLSPLSLAPLTWWSITLLQMPQQIALFGSVAAHVLYLRKKQPRYVLLAGIFLLLGYASFSKSALIPVILGLITVLYFTSGGLWTRLRKAIKGYWPAWVVYGGLTVGYAAAFLVKVPSGNTQRPDVTSALETLDLTTIAAFGPGAVGGPWMWESYGDVGPGLYYDAPAVLVALTWIVLAAFWAHRTLTHRRAWWPLMILMTYVLLGALMIVASRTSILGPSITGLQPRYLIDLAGVFALCVGLTLMPIIGAIEPLAPRKVPLITFKPSRRMVIAGGVLFVAGSLTSSVAFVTPWHDDARMPQKAFVSQLRADLKDLPGPLIVADTAVPDEIVWGLFYPYNTTSRFLAPFGDRVKVVRSGTDLAMIDPKGDVARATIVGDPRSAPGPAKGCGYPISGLSRTIDVLAVYDIPLWLTVNYLAGSNSTITISAGHTTIEMPVMAGLHTAFVSTTGAYDNVTITPGPGTHLCVDSISAASNLTPESK